MKQVYTFSTGGCKEAIYLNRLSSTKEGVKQLIKDDFKEYNFDDDQSIRDIFIDDKRITIIIDDITLRQSFNRVYELVILAVS